MKVNLLIGISFAAMIASNALPVLAQETVPAPPQTGQNDVSQDNASSSISDIVVTGSRLGSGFTAPTPVTTVGVQQLETRAPATISEALTEQPAFRNNTSPTNAGGTFQVGQGLLDLRGLGSTRTLVLVDGRRHVPNNANGTWDTNVLPTALVSRVDVVTGGASAAYGSDAVAGVVNFVLNDRLEGVRGSVQAGISQYGDAGQQVVSLAAGSSFAAGRGHFVIGGDYSHGSKTGGIYERSWGRRETEFISSPGVGPAGQAGLLLADSVHYQFPLGGRIMSCVAGGVVRAGAACPIGNLQFNDDGSTRPFVLGSVVAGASMIGGDNSGVSMHRNQPLRAGTERITGLARLSFDVSDAFKIWGEFSGGRFAVDSNTADYANNGSIVILRDNPYLPDALAATMDASGISRFNMSRVGFSQNRGVNSKNVNGFWQGAIGAEGSFGDGWKWEGYFSKGRSRFHYRPQGLVSLPNYFAAAYAVDDGTGKVVCGPTATNPMLQALPAAQRAAYIANIAPGCVPLNLFGATAPSDASVNYVAPRDVDALTIYDEEAAGASINGSPFDTWAGPFTIAAGGEWRKDKASVTLDPRYAALSSISGFFAANPNPGFGKQNVKEVFAEVGIPVLRGETFFKALDLNGAIRYTDYSASGTVTTWKLGGVLDVVDGVRFRVTRSRDIRAANLPELFYKGNDAFVTVVNPVTKLSNTVNSSALNNPDLKPEKADTWTVGVVLQPKADWARGLQLSVDLFQIKIDGVIGTIPQQVVVNDYFSGLHPEYASLITLDPTQPSGLSRVNSPQLNLNQTKTRGADISLNYILPINMPGRISLTANASYLDQLETFGADGRSLGDLAGAVPRWRITGNVGYQSEGFSTNLTARYNSKVTFNQFLYQGPEDAGYDEPLAANQQYISQNRFPAAVYFSLNMEYAIRSEGKQKMTFFTVVDNLFNKNPPRGSFASLLGLGNRSQASFSPYDTLGRYFKAGARFEF